MRINSCWLLPLGAAPIPAVCARQLTGPPINWPQKGNGGRLRALEEKAFSLPHGIWSSRGYGMVFNVTNGHVSMIEETHTSCIHNDFLLGFLDANPEVSKNKSTAVVTAAAETINEFVFDRSESFTAGCLYGSTPVAGDQEYAFSPLQDYDILVQNFREHYAFFKQRGINWDDLTLEHRSSLTEYSSQEDLWQTLVELLTTLEDPQVSLFNGVDFVRSKDIDFEYYSSQAAKWLNITSSYMTNGKLYEPETGGLYWGHVEDPSVEGVGYLRVDSMGFEDFSAAAAAIERAVQSLQDTHTIILDVRFNLGGSDSLSFHLTSLFVNKRLRVGQKRAKDGNSWTKDQEVYLDPFPDASKRYNGNVILLTSGWTVSAAEVFTMTMMQLPRTILLGRKTIGAFSDQLQKMLPNGWRFSISNEVYEDASGRGYEIEGIPPGHYPEADFMDKRDEEHEVDSWLELAVDMAFERTMRMSLNPSSDASSRKNMSALLQVAGFCLLVH